MKAPDYPGAQPFRMQAKQMRMLALYFVSILLLFTSCSEKEGPIGPAGPAGPTGATGAVGANGQNFSNYLQTFPGTFTFAAPFSTTATAGSQSWVWSPTLHHNAGANLELSNVGLVASGATLDGGTSTMSIAVNMPNSGVCQFEVSISSELDYDYLKWFVDGTEVNGISGVGGPFVFYFTLLSGAHTIDFRYIKDPSLAAGGDGAKIDNVLITNYAVGGRMILPEPPVLPSTARLWSERPAVLSK